MNKPSELVTILMRRDGVSETEAREMVKECRDDRDMRIENGDMPFDILQEYFGLEPDYIFDLDVV